MLNKYFLISIFTLILLGCNKEEADYINYYDHLPKQERSNRSYPIRNIFQDAKIDILFVVDNSGSMGSIQQNIVKNAGLFMQEFLKNNFMKWQMGIISTDQTDIPFLGFTQKFDHVLATDPTQTNGSIVQLFQDRMNQLGTQGDPDEFVFYNILRMMKDPVYESFFRPDAHLAIIMVTDEEEQSKDEFGAQFDALSFVNTVKAFKDADKIVRFYGAFDFKDLQDCDGGSWGDEYKSSPFEAVINETSGIHMSACTANFGKRLSEIGRDIIRIIDSPRVLLKKRPKIETLKVYYDGTLIPSGKRSEGGIWFYSKKFNTINFYHLDFVKDFQNSKIRIKYDVNDGIPRN